ncbi:MAG: hypothetical protein OXQ29_26320 [Rhodospirillaceae bacterium]|nr:hypothetical protein [Rhodospirillaceae bacterium]
MNEIMQAAAMLSAIHGESIHEVLGKFTLREGLTLLLVQQMSGVGMPPAPVDQEVSQDDVDKFRNMFIGMDVDPDGVQDNEPVSD